ncbi:MAG: hypothetical protein R2838_10770 [Caldilineaceae bacterium]
MGLAMIPPEMEGKALAVPHPKFVFPDGETKVIGAMGGQPWVINSYNDDDHMRVCIDFLKWWYSDEAQQVFINDNGGLPWSKAGVEAEGFEELKPYTGLQIHVGRRPLARFLASARVRRVAGHSAGGYSAYASGQVDDPKRVLDYIAAKQQEILFDKGRSQTPVPEELQGITLL